MIKSILPSFRFHFLKIFLLATVFFQLATTPILAISAPTLSSPLSGTIVSSNTLTWQSMPDSIQYRIIVDDEPSVSSPYIKDYRTSNTYYSPQLSNGTYYWKVAAKDSNGTWSQWSDIWSFTLQVHGDGPSPTSPNSPALTPTISPTPTSTPSSFVISDIPSQINSDQNFYVQVELILPNNPNTSYYLKGAFKKEGGSNYFGLTDVDNQWIKNSSKYSQQYQIITDEIGQWTGKLKVMVDPQDGGFTGSGDYIFKVGRYSASGSGPIWSNESIINISDNTTKEDSEVDQIEEENIIHTPTAVTLKPTNKSFNKKSLDNIDLKKDSSSASVAGIFQISTSAAQVSSESVKVASNYSPVGTVISFGNYKNYFTVSGVILILLSIFIFSYMFIKHRFYKFKVKD